jgi:hypothetical protein
MRTKFLSNVSRNMPAAIVFFFAAFALQSCGKWEMPKELAGAWSGRDTVNFRTTDKAGNTVFITQEEPVRIVIHEDESMEGTIGAAVFTNCRISQNRNWIEKQLGMATDFQITGGTLHGRINDKDPFAGKEIMVPFDLKDGKLRGTVFLRNNGAKFPMVELELVRER